MMLAKPSSCSGCPLFEYPFGKKYGFSKPEIGAPGVLVVGEALGEDEEQAGTAFVGKSGAYLFQSLKRVGIERSEVSITNTVWCRPPNNKLVGMPYESKCITHCSPNLDDAISNARLRATEANKTFVIVTLGRTAFKRVMGFHDKDTVMQNDYLCYPFWNARYEAWVLAADHPAYLARGNHHLEPILQFAFKRAMEIRDSGLRYASPTYLLDPTPQEFSRWVDECLSQDGIISYDIETPYKQGEDEEEVAKADDEDYTILRCSATYRAGTGCSAPWRAEYLADWRRLFASPNAKLGWNSDNYDSPRVSRHCTINGDQIDGMLAWHVLNSALPKGLGFVTPFYVKDVPMWKHLSSAEPAFYNAKDADMAFQIWQGVERDLKKYNLWPVFENHVVKLNRIFSYMSSKGVVMDMEARQRAETDVAKLLNDTSAKIEAVIPPEARALKVYKKQPKDTAGMIQVRGTRKATQCPHCKELDVKAAHFKSIGKKLLKQGELERPCFGLKATKVVVPSSLWALPLEFKLSPQSLTRYQQVKGHSAIYIPDRTSSTRTKRSTFDEKAILRLTKKYPKDELYPLILDFRGLQKLLSVYIGTTEYVEVMVDDDYILKPGEQLVED
jgi:uracil-DNA glycosylase family 4